MELNELHVTDFHTSTEDQHHTISDRNLKIHNVTIKLSHPTHSQQHTRTNNFFQHAFIVDQKDTHNPSTIGQQHHGKLKLQDRNMLQHLHLNRQRTKDLSSNRITLHMQHAIPTLHPFTSKYELNAI